MDCKLEKLDANRVVLPAKDINRLVGNYIVRITPSRNTTTTLDDPRKITDTFSISFSISFKLTTPDWYPSIPPSSGMEEIDVSAFAIIFSISIIISFLMVFLIHRARRRLSELRIRQFYGHPMASTPGGSRVPHLYSAAIDVSVAGQKKLSLLSNSVARLFKTKSLSATEGSKLLEQQPLDGGAHSDEVQPPSNSGWRSAVPRLLRRLTKSFSKLDLSQSDDRSSFVRN